jgi:hypothetical protein
VKGDDEMTPENLQSLEEAVEILVAGMLDRFRRFMSEQWPSSTDIREMVHWAERYPLNLSERKLRLFATACSRRVWCLLPDAATRKLVEVCERHADGLATAKEMYEACPSAHFRRKTPRTLARQAVRSAVGDIEFSFASLRSTLATCAASYAAEAAGLARQDGEDTERQAQAALLRDIVGDPLEPARIDPAWLAWNGGLVVQLAKAAYDDRVLPAGILDSARLLILADALEEAGCDEKDILEHLRRPREHTRGCFVIDLLLGKE